MAASRDPFLPESPENPENHKNRLRRKSVRERRSVRGGGVRERLSPKGNRSQAPAEGKPRSAECGRRRLFPCSVTPRAAKASRALGGESCGSLALGPAAPDAVYAPRRCASRASGGESCGSLALGLAAPDAMLPAPLNTVASNARRYGLSRIDSLRAISLLRYAPRYCLRQARATGGESCGSLALGPAAPDAMLPAPCSLTFLHLPPGLLRLAGGEVDEMLRLDLDHLRLFL